MGVVIPFSPRQQRPVTWTRGDAMDLDRLVARTPGATGWEIDADGRRAFVIGIEDETLLIVARGAAGLSVTAGWERAPHWQGASLERYAHL
jgi:hypothetical protein